MPVCIGTTTISAKFSAPFPSEYKSSTVNKSTTAAAKEVAPRPPACRYSATSAATQPAMIAPATT
jgi:hypothetical protein